MSGQDICELAAVERRIAAMLRAIEDGMYNPAMKGRMTEREARKAELEAALARQPEVSEVRLHPNLAEVYRAKVAGLAEALNEEADRAEAQAIIRPLIDRVVLQPAEGGGMEALLYGELAAILALRRGRGLESNTPAWVGRGVNCRWLRGQDATYSERRPSGCEGPTPSRPAGQKNGYPSI